MAVFELLKVWVNKVFCTNDRLNFHQSETLCLEEKATILQ